MSDAPQHSDVTRRRSPRRLGQIVVWNVLRMCLVVVLIMMLLERSLIFFPDRLGDWNPADLVFEDAWFESGDGTQLHGWYLEHERPRAVMLFMHGNAGNLTDRKDVVRMLQDQLQISVMIFDYRGYGRSNGRPDEEGILADARAARRWLANRTGSQEGEIVLLGRSLGGGVAVDLATDGARGLVLESTFTSLPDTAAYHYPWLPVQWIMRTRLNSLGKIGRYRGPLLQSHGTADEVVPFELGRRLFEAAPGPNKEFVTLEDLGHNDLQPASYYDQLAAFIGRLNGE